MMNDILEVQDKTTDTIQLLLKKLQTLCEALGEPMPNIGANGLCLYEEQNQLQKYIATYVVLVGVDLKSIYLGRFNLQV